MSTSSVVCVSPNTTSVKKHLFVDKNKILLVDVANWSFDLNFKPKQKHETSNSHRQVNCSTMTEHKKTKEWVWRRRHELEKPFALFLPRCWMFAACAMRIGYKMRADQVSSFFLVFVQIGQVKKRWKHILIWILCSYVFCCCWINFMFISATMINNNDNISFYCFSDSIE